MVTGDDAADDDDDADEVVDEILADIRLLCVVVAGCGRVLAYPCSVSWWYRVVVISPHPVTDINQRRH